MKNPLRRALLTCLAAALLLAGGVSSMAASWVSVAIRYDPGPS